MKKPLLIITILIIVALLPGCREKHWWEDCYSSEEEARLDHIEAEFYAMKEENDTKIEELESEISDLKDEVDELQSR